MNVLKLKIKTQNSFQLFIKNENIVKKIINDFFVDLISMKTLIN